MAESLADWLALREAADAAARSVALTHALVEALPRERPLRILDLGTGTGSNVRYLAPRLPLRQEWLVVDRDPDLLALIPHRMSISTATERLHIVTRQMNLGALDEPDIFTGRHLVTASALLDLVSEDWLTSLAERCREAGAAVLFALSYVGRSRCSPEEPVDEEIRELMNRHQRTNDKGFGRAAGPDAVDCAERAFEAAGYFVRRDASDWVLTPDAPDLQRQVVEGWAQAAREIAPERSATIDDWLRRRLAHVDEDRSRIVVCHEDFIAWLGGPERAALR